MADTMPIPVLGAKGSALRVRSLRPPRAVLVGGIAGGALLLCVLAAWFAGVRVFIVESPSMGTAAPVGSVVIGSAGSVAHPGDVITFQPPGPGSTPYTHRVVSVGAAGIRTKGDINGADDPWVITSSMVISRAVAVLPGLGWVVKAAPFVLASLVVAQVIGLWIHSPARRWSIRTAALAVGIAFVAWVVRPFSGFVLLQSHAAPDGMHATVVSTALLPIRVTALGGGHVELLAGQVGNLVLPRDHGGRVTMVSQLALDPIGWVLVAVVCLTPVIAALTFGVPVGDDRVATA